MIYPEIRPRDPCVRQLRSCICYYPTAATTCGVKRDNPSKNSIPIDAKRRQKLGDFIRKFDFVNAEDDNTIGNELNDFEGQCKEDITLDEIKDAYAAFQEKVCDRKFGYRHSHSYWAAYSATYTLDRVKRYLDDESEATLLEFGRLDVNTWLAMVKAGPNSAHLDLMKKFRGDNSEIYVQACKKEELVTMLQTMKIQFKFDTNDTDVNEQTYGNFLYNQLVWIFKDMGLKQLKLVQMELLILYLHYLKQMPHFTEKMTTYVGYLIRDMVDGFEQEVDGRTVRNPYLGLKNVEVMKAHTQALKEMLIPFNGDIRDQRLEETLKQIIKAAMIDKVVEPLFDSLMDLCVSFIQRETYPENSNRILSTFRTDLIRQLKEVMKLTPAMLDTCLKSVKAMVARVEDKLEKPLLDLADEIIDEVICPFPKMSPAQVKSVLDLMVKLLASGHQSLIKVARTILRHDNLETVFLWKKYTDEVKAIFTVVGQQPVDRMWPERDRDDHEEVVGSYSDFMENLLEKLEELKMMPKLNQEVKTYIFQCLDESPPAKAELAKHASRDKFFIIRKADPPEFREEILVKCDKLVNNEDLTWNIDMNEAVVNLLDRVIGSYDKNGRLVTPKQHELFMSVFMTCLAGDDMDDTFYPPGQEKYGGVKLWVFRSSLIMYIALHVETATHSCCVGMLPDIIKWVKMAEDEERDDVKSISMTSLQLFSVKPPQEIAKYLPQIMELFITPSNMSNLFTLVNSLYPDNPEPVHSRLSELLDMFETLKETERALVTMLLTTVAATHPEVITDDQVGFLFKRCQGNTWDQQSTYLNVLYSIAKRYPDKIQPHFSKLIDDKTFSEQTLPIRASVITCAVGRNEKYGQQAIDFFIKMAANKDSTKAQFGLNQMSYLVKDQKEYMQKYKANLQKIERSSTVPEVRQSCNNIIQVLEGKNYEDVFEDLYKEIQEQQEATAELDGKLDHTMQTVITMGDHVTEHHKELIDVKRNLGDVEEKVEEINEDLGKTKVKVEEIDNKTMTNAPKWSRDLTKLMNPEQEADWRLLASRLGYSNDDIRAWSQQHDPCMALLSEWYATHKTSEANHAVLNSLVEMNRMDGVAIVENAMKASECVVEDEEFEYPNPPPIFLSYQWGMQDEVKLLKQHLNMAGYECWMDIGQMGGGDKLFAKIDNGIRAAKVIICCVTEKYAQSPNCNREVNLSVNLGKPIIPLLMEKMNWPPKGSMGPIFSEYLFIRFFQRGGEETKDTRYWPVPKFQELLMQLNYSVPPDESMIKKEYNKWWAPIVEDIVIDKNKKSKSTTSANSSSGQSHDSSDTSPVVFLSYQWGKQPQVKALYQRIRSLGYTVWMDIFQMGGGDSLYDKIDRGVRGCEVVVTCVTPKYALSANCRREVSLADALKKPIIPLLMEQMKWPPDGPMSMVFTELLYIQVYRDPDIQTKWAGEKFDELAMKIKQYVGDGTEPIEDTPADQGKENTGPSKSQPDGSASKSNFVEPKTKVPKTPAKDNKPTSPKPKQTEGPAQTPQKETEKSVPVQSAAPRQNFAAQKDTTDTADNNQQKKPNTADKKTSKSCVVL